ncbi:MAG: 50S ribosomal protein L29 [Candidatus Aenigmatarchaeota archaeon]
MAILKMKKLREMNEKDNDEKLMELKLELSKERASSNVGTIKNPGRIKEIRKTIARILTIKSEKNNTQAKKKQTGAKGVLSKRGD